MEKSKSSSDGKVHRSQRLNAARRWTIGQQIALGFAFPIVVLFALVSFSHQGARNLMETTRAVAYGYETRSKFHTLEGIAQNAAIGEMAFLLTGEEKYLVPYYSAAANAAKIHDELVGEVTDPRQKKALEHLYAAFRARLELVGQTIEVRRREGLEAASNAIEQGRFKDLDHAIDHYAREVRGYQTEANEAERHSSVVAAMQLEIILWIGTAATALIAMAAGFFVIRRLNRQIGSAVQRMRSASAELEAAATQQTKGATEQVSTSAEVSTTIQELVATSRQIAASARQVTQVAGETATAAGTGDEMMRNAGVAIEDVRRQMDRIVSHMLDLGRKSHQIGGILEMINKLAEQTNILSINATIEAVGAGESGQRFAVVAGEIRRLADRVGDSAKQIRSLVDDVRTAANTTLLATEDGSKAVDTGSRRFAEAASSLKRISEYVDSAVQASREIEVSTKQQQAAVEQVNMAMKDVAQAARNTEMSSGQTLQTAGALASLSEELVRLVQRHTVAPQQAPA